MKHFCAYRFYMIGHHQWLNLKITQSHFPDCNLFVMLSSHLDCIRIIRNIIEVVSMTASIVYHPKYHRESTVLRIYAHFILITRGTHITPQWYGCNTTMTTVFSRDLCTENIRAIRNGVTF